jgi:hypothetical protein
MEIMEMMEMMEMMLMMLVSVLKVHGVELCVVIPQSRKEKALEGHNHCFGCTPLVESGNMGSTE